MKKWGLFFYDFLTFRSFKKFIETDINVPKIIKGCFYAFLWVATYFGLMSIFIILVLQFCSYLDNRGKDDAYYLKEYGTLADTLNPWFMPNFDDLGYSLQRMILLDSCDTLRISLSYLDDEKASYLLENTNRSEQITRIKFINDTNMPLIEICNDCQWAFDSLGKKIASGFITVSKEELAKLKKNHYPVEYTIHTNEEDFIKRWKWSLSSNDSSTIIDQRDGNRYKTIRYGNQIWMAENIRFNKNIGIKDKKGNVLYTYDELPNICPVGWHMPNTGDIKEFESFIQLYWGREYPKHVFQWIDFEIESNILEVQKNKDRFLLTKSMEEKEIGVIWTLDSNCIQCSHYEPGFGFCPALDNQFSDKRAHIIEKCSGIKVLCCDRFGACKFGPYNENSLAGVRCIKDTLL